MPGYLSALLQISSTNQFNEGGITVDLAAAIQLGSVVEHHWKFKDEAHAKKITVEGF